MTKKTGVMIPCREQPEPCGKSSPQFTVHPASLSKNMEWVKLREVLDAAEAKLKVVSILATELTMSKVILLFVCLF